MEDEIVKYFFYNLRGRKIEIESGQIRNCILRGFSQTDKDSPIYNPIYDKSRNDVMPPALKVDEQNISDMSILLSDDSEEEVDETLIDIIKI